MPKSIPGFDEAVAIENRERIAAYLDLAEEIGGVSIRQMTPMDLCALSYAQSPFVNGGTVTHATVAQFLYVLRDDAKMTKEEAVAAIQLESLDSLFSEIKGYIDTTFRDFPRGGVEMSDAPIVASVAWLEYRMAHKPWRWSRKKTLSTPLRIIYQQIRCQTRADGKPVVNSLSHKKSNDFLGELNRQLQAGEITVEDVQRMNTVRNN